MRKIVTILLCVLMSFSFFACNNANTGMVGDAYLITLYRARSSGMLDGTEDDRVAKALEDKFFADTGIKIKLQMRMYTNTDLPTQVDMNYPKTSASMEAVMHYISEDAGSAITKYAKEKDACIDVEPLLEEYGQNILKNLRANDPGHLAERAAYFPIGDEYKMTAIPCIEEESRFGMLVRKDLFKQVQSSTGIDPDEYDIKNDNYKNMTVAEFDKVLKAIKALQLTDMRYPFSGYPWDVTRVIAPALGVDAFNYGLDVNGKIVPPQFTEDFDRYLDIMYQWCKDGIWEKDNVTMTEESRLTAFVANQTAVFACYPEVKQLIKVAKAYKAGDGNTGEVMVIAPLALSDRDGKPVLDKDGNRVVKGNLKSPRSFSGLILPSKAKNPEKTIQFIDWMYANPDNYELAKYGIKGEHWIEDEDITISGKTYKTWNYPDGKADEFSVKPPYAGCWEILPNINVSNRMNATYNTTERKWYAKITNEFPTFSCLETEGMWLPTIPRKLGAEAQNVDGQYVDDVRGKAWAGITGAGGKTPVELLSDYRAEVIVSSANYFNFIDESYKKSVKYFKDKWVG